MILNGVVTLISRENGKCLDYSVLSKKFKGCQYWSTGAQRFLKALGMTTGRFTRQGCIKKDCA